MSSTTEATTSASSAHQTSYGWLREVLCGAVQAEVASRPGIGTIGCRATAALNALLLQPVEALRFRPGPELQVHLDAPSPSNTFARDVADAPPRSAPSSAEPRTEPFQTPAVPSPLPPRRFPQSGTAGPTHGRVGVYSAPRPRRGPSDDPSSVHVVTGWFAPRDPAGRQSSSPVGCRSSSPRGWRPAGPRSTGRLDLPVGAVPADRQLPLLAPLTTRYVTLGGHRHAWCGPPDLHRGPPPAPLSAAHIIEWLRALLPAIGEEHR